MPALPDPLHPAIIHFPVVLILLGTCAALVAIFWRKNHVPILAAALLTLGALGAWVAVQTGKSDGGLLVTLSPQAEALLDQHQDWGQRTLFIALAAAIIAIASAVLIRFPRLARITAAAAALTAVTASYGVYQTGHRGGALVFHHGAGVMVAQSDEPTGTLADRSDLSVNKSDSSSGED